MKRSEFWIIVNATLEVERKLINWQRVQKKKPSQRRSNARSFSGTGNNIPFKVDWINKRLLIWEKQV